MRGRGGNFRGRGRGNGGQRGFNRGRGWRGGFRGRGRGNGAPSAGKQYENRNISQTLGPRLLEVDVGITEYISKHDGFKATMKERFSDFHVNEIDLDGNIVKLTDLEIPVEADHVEVERHKLIPEEVWQELKMMTKKVLKPASKSRKEAEESDGPIKVSCDESALKKPNPSCSESPSTMDTNQTESAIVVSSSEKDVPQAVEIDVTALDKEGRRAIHTCVKAAFKEVNGNTIEKGGKKFVVFSQGKDSSRGNRGRWPASRNGEYLHFVVHKRNMDTTETVSLITRKLGMKPNSLSFAGTKDKRGNTSQLMCIRWGEPLRLYHLSKFLRDVKLGNYTFKEKALRLGDLKGNQFKIALRNCEGSDDQINAGLESLKSNGFINYYGLQRFGNNKAVPTHSVGRALFLGDWEKAVDLILYPREGFDDIKEALEEWKSSRNAKDALLKIKQPTYCLERLLLEGLAIHGSKDFVSALTKVPRNTRLMYLHAYQSLIWNKSVSERIKKYGLVPVAGDLVLTKSEKKICSDEMSVPTDDPELVDSLEADIVEVGTSNEEVYCITENDKSNYNIEDIVLPLPGTDVAYPNNSIGTFMKDLLKEDGISFDTAMHNVKDYSASGTYRHIVARADKLSWEIIHYNDPAKDLILGDFDEIEGKDVPTDEPGGQYKAILLTMCLEPSTYATMAFREITKMDSSALSQALHSAVSKPVEAKTVTCEQMKEEKPLGSVVEAELSASTGTISETLKDETSEGGKNTDEGSTSVDASSQADAMDAQNESVSGLKRKMDGLSDGNFAEKRAKET